MDFDTIYKKIKNEEYENKLPYPENDFPVKPILSCASKYYDLAKVEYQESLKKYKDEKRVYRETSSRLNAEFQKDVIQMLISEGLNQTQAEKVYSRAWNEGHSAGISEVLSCAYNLIELF